ncbi:hypothetical protein SUDANB1_04067 [Streptomyces sp. enrichment culture]
MPVAAARTVPVPVIAAPTIPVGATVPVPVTSTMTIAVIAATAIPAAGTVPVAMPVAATGATQATGAMAGALAARGSTGTTVTTGRTGTRPATEARSVLTAARGTETPVAPLTPVAGPGTLPPGLPLPASGGEIMAVATAAAVSGAGPAGRLGRWVGGTLRRGHRPIIARTRGALCSPRQNCR